MDKFQINMQFYFFQRSPHNEKWGVYMTIMYKTYLSSPYLWDLNTSYTLWDLFSILYLSVSSSWRLALICYIHSGSSANQEEWLPCSWFFWVRLGYLDSVTLREICSLSFTSFFMISCWMNWRICSTLGLLTIGAGVLTSCLASMFRPFQIWVPNGGPGVFFY